MISISTHGQVFKWSIRILNNTIIEGTAPTVTAAFLTASDEAINYILDLKQSFQ